MKAGLVFGINYGKRGNLRKQLCCLISSKIQQHIIRYFTTNNAKKEKKLWKQNLLTLLLETKILPLTSKTLSSRAVLLLLGGGNNGMAGVLIPETYFYNCWFPYYANIKVYHIPTGETVVYPVVLGEIPAEKVAPWLLTKSGVQRIEEEKWIPIIGDSEADGIEYYNFVSRTPELGFHIKKDMAIGAGLSVVKYFEWIYYEDTYTFQMDEYMTPSLALCNKRNLAPQWLMNSCDVDTMDEQQQFILDLSMARIK